MELPSIEPGVHQEFFTGEGGADPVVVYNFCLILHV
jgi:hypothetical protein